MQVSIFVGYSTVLVPDVRAAMDFREWLGGEYKINKYNHALAIAGGKYLAELLGTRVMDPDGEFTLNMVGGQRLIPQCSSNIILI